MEDTTILITHVGSRNKEIKRCLGVYRKYKVRVLALGPKENTSFKNNIHVPDTQNLWTKLQIGLANTSSKYVAWCADDDFILQSFLIEAEKVLNTDASINCVDLALRFQEKRLCI